MRVIRALWDGPVQCSTEGCLVTDVPIRMYNLKCDYRQVSMEELRQKVVCNRCAERIASESGVPLGKEGCGTYPLSLTLRRRASSEQDRVPDDAKTYVCGDTSCDNRHVAEHMYNIRMGKALNHPSDLMAYIRCGPHARAHARERGTEPCMPDSDVFRLEYTLRVLEERQRKASEIASRDADDGTRDDRN